MGKEFGMMNSQKNSKKISEKESIKSNFQEKLITVSEGSTSQLSNFSSVIYKTHAT